MASAIELLTIEIAEYHWAASTMAGGSRPGRGTKRPCPRLSNLTLRPAKSRIQSAVGWGNRFRQPVRWGRDHGRHRDDADRRPRLDRDRGQLGHREGDGHRPRPPRRHRRPGVPRSGPRRGRAARGRRAIQEPPRHLDARGPRAYGQSKLAQVLFTAEFARRLAGTGVTVNACHPGVIKTNLGGTASAIFRFVRMFFKSPAKGAETPVFLVASPSVSTLTGQYFADRRVKPPSRAAQDSYTARRLYDVSVKLAGLGTE